MLRLGSGRILLDLPIRTDPRSVASVWVGGDPPRWVRAVWPVDARSVLPIAPLDLWSGHVIEFSDRADEDWSATYACVLEAQDAAVVAMFAASATEAISMSSQVHAAWSRAQVETALAPFRLATAAPSALIDP